MRRQLGDARAAHADQQRSYEDCKAQRLQVNQDKKEQKEREETFEKANRNAILDGKGELDAAGEAELRRQANEVGGWRGRGSN